MQNPFLNFPLLLINTRKRQYLVLGRFLVLLSASLLIYSALLADPSNKYKMLFAGIILPLILLICQRILFAKKKITAERQVDVFLFIMTYTWLIHSFYILFALLLLLHFLFKISLRTLRLVVAPEGIRYPSFPAKMIPWSQIENLIVKDDLLTIDTKKNTLIQQLIEPNSFIDSQELEAFNTYCQQQIKAA